MKKLTMVLFCLVCMTLSIFAQNKDKGKIEVRKGRSGYYYEHIIKDIDRVNKELTKKDPGKRFTMDQTGMNMPVKITDYKYEWAQPPISQGQTGTCWCYATTSFFESELYRLYGKKVKLSEMYTVYWEYVEKARRFIQKRGNSEFSEGSEGNALKRTMKLYGAVPEELYTGLLHGRKYHTHSEMVKEMTTFLNSLKTSNAWNEAEAINTIKSIMNHYIGTPPEKFMVDGKEYTPLTYLNDFLKLHLDDFVDIISYKQEPYWQQVEYKVPDNWWHNSDYYNVPLDVYMNVLHKAIKKGYTMTIGGDVSEAGFLRETQCALIPDFDIPSAYINDDARQFRFSNKTTTDDHLMHLIGYVENYNKDGKNWYLIKDSGSGSKNNDIDAPEWGYYFFHEDYIKLKIMCFTIHKDAVKDVLKKFK